MYNKYRLGLFVIDIVFAFLLILATILIGVFIEDKIPVVIMSCISLYFINAMIALWIVTSKVRTELTKSTWILSFFIFPIISIIIFLLWGRTPYVSRTPLEYHANYKKYIDKYPNENYLINNPLYKQISKYCEYARGVKNTSDNNLELIKNQEQFFYETINYIQSAQKTILLSYYIIDQSRFFDKLSDELIKKANEGIKIFLMFDRYGCTGRFSPKMLFKLLNHKNIQIAKFESDKDIRGRSTNNFRSHKKVLIIDGIKAIYGGSNISDEYLCIRDKYPNWMDLNFKVSGSIVKTMTIDYCMDWDVNGRLPYILQLSDYYNCYKIFKPFLFIKSYFKFSSLTHDNLVKINKNRYITKSLLTYLENNNLLTTNIELNMQNISDATYVPTGPRYDNHVMNDILNLSFVNAKKSIKIISPYFQLTDNLIASLLVAKRSGIDVEIILPGTCDNKWFLLHMNRMAYGDLIREGVKIYEYAGFIHSKLIIIDDEMALTGTYNLDFRSLTSNYESILVIDGIEINHSLIHYFSNIKNHSILFSEYDGNDIWENIVQTFLYLIKPLL